MTLRCITLSIRMVRLPLDVACSPQGSDLHSPFDASCRHTVSYWLHNALFSTPHTSNMTCQVRRMTPHDATAHKSSFLFRGTEQLICIPWAAECVKIKDRRSISREIVVACGASSWQDASSNECQLSLVLFCESFVDNKWQWYLLCESFVGNKWQWYLLCESFVGNKWQWYLLCESFVSNKWQ